MKWIGGVVLVGLVTFGCGGCGGADPSQSEANIGQAAETLSSELALLLADSALPETADYYAGLGITERVSEFTTYYEPGEARVTNIERAAELTRGVVIKSGEVFSANQHIGPRTIAKGFVADEMLTYYEGLVGGEVGGGISQFSTALFNAAFFAGLNIVESQAHTYHFPRYPYGREATIHYPTIDLKIENNTPYAILIWASNTGSSTTVSLFSTTYFTDVDQVFLETTPQNNCNDVEVRRSRTTPEGVVEIDKFFTTYQTKLGEPCIK